jgi:hypothetical protein
MLVMALLAAIQWDALVIDVRDAEILEPLPVQAGTIRRAKVAAVAVFAGAAAVAVNVIPSVVFPLLLLIKQPISIISAGALMVIHAVMTLAAGAFGFLTVIALRETLAAILGRWFAVVSPWAQGALVVVFGTAILLLPPAAARLHNTLNNRSLAVPPLWFVGAYEVASGGIIIDAPRVRLTARQRDADRVASTIYRRHRSYFERLASIAPVALASVAAVAAAAYWWNARRFPSFAPVAGVRRRKRWAAAQRFIEALVSRDATVRAGFFFALAVLFRSRGHRLTLAGAVAVGLAMSVVSLLRVDLDAAAASGVAPTRLLAVQPLILGALLIAFRHAIRVPAELRASWGVQVSWHDRDRQFVSGVKRAALAGLVVPCIVLMLPLFLIVLDVRAALLHAAVGVAGSALVLEVLLLGYGKVPFTCTYLPNENIKALGPIYVIAYLIASSIFAGIERAALQDTGATVRLFAILVGVFLILCRIRARRPRLVPVDFNEAPATTQRLGLHT